MNLKTISPCSFEHTSSDNYWGCFGYSKAARFEAKSKNEIELYAYPLIKAIGVSKPVNARIVRDILEGGTYDLADYIQYSELGIKIGYYINFKNSGKLITDILEQAPFTGGLEVHTRNGAGIPYWTRFKKPFAMNGRGGDSVPILDNSIETTSYSSFNIDEIHFEQNELFYVRDIFPKYDGLASILVYLKYLHFSITTETVNLKIKSDTIENETAWDEESQSIQTFQTKMVTYYYERVRHVGIKVVFTIYYNDDARYSQMKYSWEFVDDSDEVMWVKF